MEIVIRKANIDDIKLLQEISRQTFYETFAAGNTEENMEAYLAGSFSYEKLGAELNNAGSAFYLALSDNNVIGYLKLNTGAAQTELKDENTLEIERIYVLKAAQGNNVGQLLYEKAVQAGREMGAEYIWLGVWEENQRAIRFYERNGFIAFDKHVFRLGTDEQTDIMMRLYLNDRQ